MLQGLKYMVGDVKSIHLYGSVWRLYGGLDVDREGTVIRPVQRAICVVSHQSIFMEHHGMLGKLMTCG